MYSKLFFIILAVYFIVFVESNDVMIGHATPFAKKIYSAIKEADPALWRRRHDILVSAPYNDYISAVYITDLRSDKEGEAYVAAGGVGSRTVTISLKSPSILRGYKFAIEVYAESVHSYIASNLRTLPVGGLSGIGGYPSSYPSTYPISGSTYPIGGQYPIPNGYQQYPMGR